METEIIELEKEYWQEMEDRNFGTIKRLTRFPCLVAGKNGIRQVDETTFKTMFDSSEGMKLKVLEIKSEESQVIQGKTAVIAYLIKMEYVAKGEKMAFNCACTSTWSKENEEWICAMHTETELAE